MIGLRGITILWSCISFVVAAGRLSGGSLRASSKVSVAQSQKNADVMPGEAIKRVIDMLENLIAEMDAEEAKDEQQFAEFSKWCTKQQEVTQTSIGMLTTQIEQLTAALQGLYAQRGELETDIARLNGEIAVTQRQIAQATQKRGEENAAFTSEQTDFDSSIAACNKAVDILKQHYGDGTEEKAEKPAWMTLVQVTHKVQDAIKRHGKSVHPKLMSFLQGPFDRFEAKTGDALNIVDQMKVLADTFAEDKQSAIDEEARLQKMYDELMAEKTAILNSLIAERDSQQAILNAVNQDIAEKETAKANAEAELADEQAYLKATKKTCDDTAFLFEQRKKDRAAEKLATQEAIKVLSGSAGEALTQISHQVLIQRASTSHHAKAPCAQCDRAASMLSQAAHTYRSSLLMTAAAATLGSDAIQDILNALSGLIDNLDAAAKMEKEHKEWCEKELSETQAKKASHIAMVEELKQKIADETETIAEKKQGIADTIESIARADKNFDEATALRAEQKQKFEEELQNYNDALAALNQAIDILSKFYASKKKGFLQTGDEVAPREVAPGVFDNAYKQKGGAGIIEMISTVRKEYEQGKADLEKAEAEAIADYANTKAAYQQARRDLVTQQDRLTAELQTAEANLSQFQDDKQSNEEEIAAATAYLGQLASSCDSLLKHYDDRVKLRAEEKKAIQDAMKVLREEA